jgi:type IV pilus assembly protein PilC
VAKRYFLSKNITQFLSELALLLETDISTVEALNIVQQDQEEPAMHRLIGAIQTDVENGMSLAESWAKYPQYFEPFLVEILREGERQNQLRATLNKLVDYRESMGVTESDLSKRILASSIYFWVVFAIMFIVASILLIYVVPVFADMFSSFGGELPILTQLVVSLSDFLAAYWIPILIVFLGLVAFMLVKLDSVKLYSPVFGHLYRKIMLVRSWRTCAFMLSNQASLTKAIEAAAQAIHNPVYAKLLQQVNQQLAEDITLPEALKKVGFPEKVIHAAAVGIKTKQLDKLLDKVADIYTKQLYQVTEQTIRIFNLAVIILFGSIVGLLVLAMYLPIFSMGAVI